MHSSNEIAQFDSTLAPAKLEKRREEETRDEKRYRIFLSDLSCQPSHAIRDVWTRKVQWMLGNDSNQYLEQDVMTASPARLRWLLLQKATSLSKLVRDLWREERRDSALQWQLRLRDILNELLSGITGKDELAKQVSDLYIFMLTLLTKAEVAGEFKPLDDLHNLLEIELETWDLVQKQLSAAPRAAAMPTLSYGASSDSPLSGAEGSLCLDA